MAKPSILALDDEPAVLNAIERDLRRQYGRDYRILKAGSGASALDALRQLKERNDPLALLLVDQRMPDMEGTQFLAEAMKLYPDARKVLLTAYADTQAAIESINRIGLDYYLMKPWDPPESHLYPVLDELLDEWQASAPLPYEGIRVAGTRWSPRTHQVKSFLALNRIPYQYLDVEKDAEAAALVRAGSGPGEAGGARLPVVYFPDGSVLVDPEPRELAEKTGLRRQATQPFYDLIILGAGPAGLGAAVYAASEGLRTAVIEREATGGQAGTSSRIENYLGFPKGVSGAELARRATTQALRFGAEILSAQEAVSVRAEGPYRIVRLDDGSDLTCHAAIVATGVTARRLDLPGVAALSGAGIYYGAALSEAATYRDEPVVVVGGANSAGQGAMFFSRFASKVTLIVRASSLEKGMSQYLVEQIRATPNIDVRLQCEVLAVQGGRHLEEIEVGDAAGRRERLRTPALFLFIGAVPHSEAVAGLVECNSAGFILTGADLLREGKRPRGWPHVRDPYLLETSLPGLFAAGDVRQGAVRRVSSAVGEGAVAVGLVHQYLRTV